MRAAAFAIADTVAVTPENQVEQRALEKAKLYPPQPLHTQPLKLGAEKLDDIATVLRLMCGDSSELAGLYETVDAEDLKAAKAAHKKRTVAANKRALGILLGAAGIRDGTTTTAGPASQATSSSSSAEAAPDLPRTFIVDVEIDAVAPADYEELEGDEFHDRGHGEPAAQAMEVRINVPTDFVEGSRLLAKLPDGTLLDVHVDSAASVVAGELINLTYSVER